MNSASQVSWRLHFALHSSLKIDCLLTGLFLVRVPVRLWTICIAELADRSSANPKLSFRFH